MTDDELQQPLARWVGEIEDVARLAARDAAAARFLLGNLVLELGRTGLLMDAHAFIDRLLVGAQQAPDQSQALQEYLQELRERSGSWFDPALVGELIEYHSARGAFSVDAANDRTMEWARAATTAAPVLDVEQLASVASGPVAVGAAGLIRLGPLPPLQMEPDGEPVLARYRELAQARYGRAVTADQDAWSTCP